jgi:hypothetical protein
VEKIHSLPECPNGPVRRGCEVLEREGVERSDGRMEVVENDPVPRTEELNSHLEGLGVGLARVITRRGEARGALLVQLRDLQDVEADPARWSRPLHGRDRASS